MDNRISALIKLYEEERERERERQEQDLAATIHSSIHKFFALCAVFAIASILCRATYGLADYLGIYVSAVLFGVATMALLLAIGAVLVNFGIFWKAVIAVLVLLLLAVLVDFGISHIEMLDTIMKYQKSVDKIISMIKHMRSGAVKLGAVGIILKYWWTWPAAPDLTPAAENADANVGSADNDGNLANSGGNGPVMNNALSNNIDSANRAGVRRGSITRVRRAPTPFNQRSRVGSVSKSIADRPLPRQTPSAALPDACRRSSHCWHKHTLASWQRNDEGVDAAERSRKSRRAEQPKCENVECECGPRKLVVQEPTGSREDLPVESIPSNTATSRTHSSNSAKQRLKTPTTSVPSEQPNGAYHADTPVVQEIKDIEMTDLSVDDLFLRAIEQLALLANHIDALVAKEYWYPDLPNALQRMSTLIQNCAAILSGIAVSELEKHAEGIFDLQCLVNTFTQLSQWRKHSSAQQRAMFYATRDANEWEQWQKPVREGYLDIRRSLLQILPLLEEQQRHGEEQRRRNEEQQRQKEEQDAKRAVQQVFGNRLQEIEQKYIEVRAAEMTNKGSSSVDQQVVELHSRLEAIAKDMASHSDINELFVMGKFLWYQIKDLPLATQFARNQPRCTIQASEDAFVYELGKDLVNGMLPSQTSGRGWMCAVYALTMSLQATGGLESHVQAEDILAWMFSNFDRGAARRGDHQRQIGVPTADYHAFLNQDPNIQRQRQDLGDYNQSLQEEYQCMCELSGNALYAILRFLIWLNLVPRNYRLGIITHEVAAEGFRLAIYDHNIDYAIHRGNDVAINVWLYNNNAENMQDAQRSAKRKTKQHNNSPSRAVGHWMGFSRDSKLHSYALVDQWGLLDPLSRGGPLQGDGPYNDDPYGI